MVNNHRNDVANIFMEFGTPDRTEENKKYREEHPTIDYSQNLKTKNTCNKLEEDACGLASGSKVRETLSSPVSLNLNSTNEVQDGK